MLKTSLLFAATAFALPALADTHISYVDDAGQPGTQMYVKGGMVRIEGSKGRSIAIYDVASNRMTVLMPEQNKYLVFDEKTADQMGAEASAAQQQMQAAMAQMTPEQKAQVQQMMAAQGSQPGNPAASLQAGAPKVEMQDLGTSETVAGHGCRDVQVMINGRPSSTLCVTDSPTSLGIPSADLKTLEKMRDNMQKLMAHMGPMAQGMSGVMSKGLALKTTRQTMQDFKRVSVTDTFQSVSSAGLSGSLFQVPAGYTQTTMQELMQQGHQ